MSFAGIEREREEPSTAQPPGGVGSRPAASSGNGRFRAGPGAPFALACAGLLLSACSERSVTRTIEVERDVVGSKQDLALNLSSKERFRLREFGMGSQQAPPQESQLAWDTPEGWIELPASAMRNANFRVAGDTRSECYLTLLSGDAGGLLANVNRWRAQMSQPPADEAALDALERWDFMGGRAPVVDLAGEWTGMSGTESGKDYRLVGILSVDPGGSAFLKMFGPASVIDAQVDAFRSLAKSFRTADAQVVATSAAGAPPALDAPSSAGGMTWEAPSGWRKAPDKPARLVTFIAGEGEGVECYVTELSGAGGGAAANVNRWRKQLGRDDLSEDELAKLRRVPMLGGEGLIVEIDGAFTPTGGREIQDALLYGAVYVEPERSVFVKLVGPRDRVEPQRAAFESFCRSLKE